MRFVARCVQWTPKPAGFLNNTYNHSTRFLHSARFYSVCVCSHVMKSGHRINIACLHFGGKLWYHSNGRSLNREVPNEMTEILWCGRIWLLTQWEWKRCGFCMMMTYFSRDSPEQWGNPLLLLLGIRRWETDINIGWIAGGKCTWGGIGIGIWVGVGMRLG